MPTPPISLEQAIIAGNLHSTMFGILLMGIYTSVYIVTLHIYLRKEQRSHIVLGITSLLFGVTWGQIGLQWYNIKLVFVDHNDSRQSLFVWSNSPPGSVDISSLVLGYFADLLANTLLVWRCLSIYGGSFINISPLLVPYVAGIALCIGDIVYKSKILFKPGFLTQEHATTYDSIGAAVAVVIAVTSLTGTGLIMRRILTATSETNSSRRRYNHILWLTVESALIYSISQLMLAVVSIIVARDNDLQAIVTALYTQALVSLITGLAPTLMVARVSLASGKNIGMSTVQPVSRLQFQGQSTTVSDENDV